MAITLLTPFDRLIKDIIRQTYRADAYASFALAVSSMGSTEATLFVYDNQPVLASIAIPSTLLIQIYKGGYLEIGNGVIVTFNQRPEAGRYKIFKITGTGSVVFGAGAAIDLYPEWWTG